MPFAASIQTQDQSVHGEWCARFLVCSGLIGRIVVCFLPPTGVDLVVSIGELRLTVNEMHQSLSLNNIVHNSLIHLVQISRQDNDDFSVLENCTIKLYMRDQIVKTISLNSMEMLTATVMQDIFS